MIGNNLIKFRDLKGLTKKDLSIKLEVSETMIELWENDVKIPKLNYLDQLASLYRVSVEDIIEGNFNNFNKSESIYTKSANFLTRNIKIVSLLVLVFVGIITFLLLTEWSKYIISVGLMFLIGLYLCLKYKKINAFLMLITTAFSMENVIYTYFPQAYDRLYSSSSNFYIFPMIILVISLLGYILFLTYKKIKNNKNISLDLSILILWAISSFLIQYSYNNPKFFYLCFIFVFVSSSYILLINSAYYNKV